MNLRIIPTATFLLNGILCFSQQNQIQEKFISDSHDLNKKPNIVIFFVDDMGWADWGVHNPQFKTPNMDQLKKDGMEFTRAYIATATCSPSRASLLTGKEPVRFMMPRHIENEDPDNTTEEFNQWPTDPVKMPSRNWLPLEEITYAERLKEYGYYNAFIGKWHLGGKAFYPTKQGFDEETGVNSFGHPKNYYFPFFPDNSAFPENKKGDYLIDALTDKTVDFIQNYDKEQPFTLSLFHYGVHGPQVGREDLMPQYKAKGWEGKYVDYGAMVTATDESLGRIRKALKDKGLEKNTIILFTSDQGGYFTNFPLRGNKTGGNTLGEGGTRVPFVLYYPGVTVANSISDTPIGTIDVFPTLLEIASGKPCTDKQIQGKSLLPLLRGDKMEDRNLFLFRSYEDQYEAIISGDWKLIKYHSGIKQLYNVKDDVGEVSNLIFNKPGLASKLQKDLDAWEKEAVPKY